MGLVLICLRRWVPVLLEPIYTVNNDCYCSATPVHDVHPSCEGFALACFSRIRFWLLARNFPKPAIVRQPFCRCMTKIEDKQFTLSTVQTP